MRSIKTQITFGSMTSKKDGSLGIRIETPELSEQERVEFMKLQPTVCTAIFDPIDETTDIMEVKHEVDAKTPSQRLRAVLFILYRQSDQDKPFSQFYDEKMEAIISKLKERIEE